MMSGHDRALVLVGVAGADVQLEPAGQVEGPVRIQRDAVCQHLALVVGELRAEVVVLDLAAGLATELIQANHAAHAAARIVVQLHFVADLVVVVGAADVGQLDRRGVEVDVGLAVRFALGHHVLHCDVLVRPPVHRGRRALGLHVVEVAHA
ncbi:hypothetical protein G6F40_014236 [Rhizopus arrhizus]|nr:hypothetical protein G6F40_014236 [Rhizopus arrhizus]